eukprot:4103409-Pleurochrysis_carterae.AAC.1
MICGGNVEVNVQKSTPPYVAGSPVCESCAYHVHASSMEQLQSYSFYGYTLAMYEHAEIDVSEGCECRNGVKDCQRSVLKLSRMYGLLRGQQLQRSVNAPALS